MTLEKKAAKEIEVSHHILPTSSNFLGICFLILSLIKINRLGRDTYLDEVLILPILLFFFSAILSYFAIRSRTRPSRFESAADYLFLAGLFSITLISAIFVFELMI